MKSISCIFIFIALYALSGCHSANESSAKAIPDSTYTISGKITGLDTGWVWLRHRIADSTISDSVRADSGRFEFKGRVDEPQLGYLGITENGEKRFRLSFFIDNSHIQLEAARDSIFKATISGSPAQDEYKVFTAGLKSIDDREKPLYALYDTLAVRGNKKGMDSLTKIYGQFETEKKDYAKSYARQHPSSTVAAYGVYDYYFIEPDPKELDSVYNQLSSGIKNSYYGRKIKEVLDKSKLTAVGNPAPLFTQHDKDGNEISLASFHGKYVLVDFWASWCGPCRGENPNVVKVYKKYHPKGFEILGVSLDDEKDKWLEAVRKDQLSWPQVSDLKGWNNSVAKQYGILAIPTNFLLDKDGKIVAKSLRGDDLEKKLHELMN